MKAKLLTGVLVCLLAAGAVVLLVRPHGQSASATDQGGMPPATVSTTIVRDLMWRNTIHATGEVRAVQGADLSAEVGGIAGEIDFASGQDVQAGTVLLRLRPNDDDARLAQLQAQAALAQSNLARDRRQFEAQAISRATLDGDQSTLTVAQSQVAAQQALMAEKVVRAPFAGRLGLRLVDLGQYLTAGTPIVTLQALDPIYVDFNVQQQAVGRLAVGQPVVVHVDAWPGRSFAATLTSINSRVDSASRMVMVRAKLGNRDHALLPGMFAVADIDTGAPRPRLTLPQSAISYNPYGDFVYILVPGPHGGLVAQSRVVTTGDARGDQVAILSGLSAGEQVVTAGQLKLRSGAAAVVNNRVQPADAALPSVADE